MSQWNLSTPVPLLAINEMICPNLNSGKHWQVLAAAMEQQRAQNAGSSSPYVPLERAAHADLEKRAANIDLESQSPHSLMSQSHASGAILKYAAADCNFVSRFEWWERREGSGQRGWKPVDEKPGLRGQPDELGPQCRRECDGRPLSHSQVSPLSNLQSFLRRMSVKPAEEEKGIFKRKKTAEPVMVFSFSAEEVAGEESQ